jgi:hypothetical protein
MFAFHRSQIGQVALILGCISALAATSVQAQDAGVDAGAPVLEVAPPVADAPVPEAPLPEAAPTNLETGADPQTGVRGRIVDATSGLGLEMAPVLIVDRERTRSAITITNGAYELNVPPGLYTVRSFYDMHHGARLANVRVSRGRFTEVNLLLDPIDEVEEIEVEEIEVAYRADTTTIAAQDELRRQDAKIGDNMGSQQMSQSGASDAGSAARRVVGVTVEGASLVIRGLGGRYTRVYMNGAPLPSTDPDSPSVDLDLFPASIIDSMTVSKTFLPEMPADFAGGVLEITTVTFPREFTLKLGAQAEYSSAATLGNRLDYRGGSYDFLGYDDGTRAIPSAIANTRFKTDNYDDRGLSIARSFKSSWEYRNRTALPNGQLNATLGDSMDLGRGVRFGYLFTTQYNHKERRTTGQNRRYGIPTIYPIAETGAEDVQLAGVGTASLDVGSDHSFTLLSMFNRSASDTTTYRQGQDADLGPGVEQWQLQFTSRQLWFNQLLGDHRNLGGTRMRLRWNTYVAPSGREDPDRRNVTLVPTDGWPANGSSPQIQNNTSTRIYSDLQGLDGGGSANLRFPLWSDGWATVGGGARITSRRFDTRRFNTNPKGSQTNEDLSQPVDTLLGPAGLGVYTSLTSETTDPRNDRFDARQLVYIGFAQVETPVVGDLSFAGGVRTEVYKQRLEIGSPFAGEVATVATPPSDRTDVNALPGASFKYDLGHDMLLRLAYGLTVARPQARELASFLFYDYIRDRNVVGNPNLKTTNIHNLDLRWEWFFAEAQLVAVTLFYKNFRNPIEQYQGAGGTSVAFGNTPSAQNAGAELELRTSLEHVAPLLRNFEFGSNLTLVYSRVEIPPALSMAVAPGPRRMFGQAPYVINMSLRFADPVTKTSLGLVYNVVGPRLTDVGFRNGSMVLPNIEDQPIHSLDMIGTWQLTDHFTLKARWRNMLLQSRKLKQGGTEILRTNPGTFVMFGLDYAY